MINNVQVKKYHYGKSPICLVTRQLLFVSLAAVALFAASCSKESHPTLFSASAEATADDSKVTYSNGDLLWSAGDKISICDAASNEATYSLTSGAGSSHGNFGYSSGSELSAAPYNAVYPASLRTSATQICLPTTQTSPDGSLQSLPMYAVSSDEKLMFYNLCGVVRFRLSSSGAVSLRSIAVTANRNINGTATISGYGTSSAISTPTGNATTSLLMDAAQSLASTRDFYMYLPAASYSTFNIKLLAANGATCTKTANRAITVERGKITTITLTGLSFADNAPEGMLSGEFTINASGSTVHFSQGNLQYQASTGTWRFAEHQWDFVGSQNPSSSNQNPRGTVAGSDNRNISSTYSGWIDLFGWGTSGWDNGNYWYMPYSRSWSWSEPYTLARGYGYGPTDGTSYMYSLTGRYANADWGVFNAISNGGNIAGMWRTLTRNEWSYILYIRHTSTVNGTVNARYVKATVNGIEGLILFPDSYSHPAGVTLPTNINTNNGLYSDNTYSIADWTQMESVGVMFLPAGGMRSSGNGVTFAIGYNGDISIYGEYWTSSHDERDGLEGYACCLYFHDFYIFVQNGVQRYMGHSVRLARE